MSYKLPILFLPVAALLLVAAPASANPAQRQILDFSINMGWAVGSLDMFGRDTADVSASLARARAHLSAAERMFGEPHRARRSRARTGARLLTRLNNYARMTRGRGARYKSHYVKNILKHFQRSLAVTYDTRRRPNPWRAQSTCDSRLAQVGFYFGAASIGNMAGRRGSSYASRALNVMRQGIQGGLGVALDGYPPNRTHARKLCCHFGTAAQWRSVSALRPNSRRGAFDRARGTMQHFVKRAGGRSHGGCSGTCASGHAKTRIARRTRGGSCYRDGRRRDLSGYTFRHRRMTVRMCVNRCRAKRYRYAGLQYSTHCFCGNRFGSYGRANNCNMRCGGNRGQSCGGRWANTIYSTGTARSTARRPRRPSRGRIVVPRGRVPTIPEPGGTTIFGL